MYLILRPTSKKLLFCSLIKKQTNIGWNEEIVALTYNNTVIDSGTFYELNVLLY